MLQLSTIKLCAKVLGQWTCNDNVLNDLFRTTVTHGHFDRPMLWPGYSESTFSKRYMTKRQITANHHAHKVLGRILKVGVQIFKQGVQGSNVHDLFNPAGPRRSPLFPRETPSQSNFMQSMLTIHLNASLLEY